MHTYAPCRDDLLWNHRLQTITIISIHEYVFLLFVCLESSVSIYSCKHTSQDQNIHSSGFFIRSSTCTAYEHENASLINRPPVIFPIYRFSPSSSFLQMSSHRFHLVTLHGISGTRSKHVTPSYTKHIACERRRRDGGNAR